MGRIPKQRVKGFEMTTRGAGFLGSEGQGI